MTFDKVLQYTGVVLGLSSVFVMKYSIILAFLLFFVGLIVIKFGTQIRFEREKFLFLHGEKNG
jgi:hypothetical protein